MRSFLGITFLLLIGWSRLQAQSDVDSVSFPNIFTPNGDEINDVFKPMLSFKSSISNYEMKIYDRYGIRILETQKYNQHWDGRTTAGLPCTEGTYFYYVVLTVEGRKIEHQGFVQLIR